LLINRNYLLSTTKLILFSVKVYGKIIETDENKKKFHWSHSYSKIYHQNGKYDSRGVFTNFQNYKVEERDRVKCVSASEGKFEDTINHINKLMCYNL